MLGDRTRVSLSLVTTCLRKPREDQQKSRDLTVETRSVIDKGPNAVFEYREMHASEEGLSRLLVPDTKLLLNTSCNAVFARKTASSALADA